MTGEAWFQTGHKLLSPGLKITCVVCSDVQWNVSLGLLCFLLPSQPLNYEKRKVHTLNIEGSNTYTDLHFSHLGPFKDSTSLRVIVGDVDEPPVFSLEYYIMDVYENSPAGTQVGTVTAVDPDSTNSAVR